MAFSRRREAVSPTPSHFFKVILAATLEDKKLCIPEKFVRQFGDELSDVATMRGPNGRVWHVKLIKDGKKIWFHDGWHDFVKYHSIGHGHFLLFKYEKNSDFQVVIFDNSACEVEYPGKYEQAENDEQNSLQQDETRIGNSVDKTSLGTPSLHFGSLRRAVSCVECSTSLESKRIKYPNDLDSLTQEEQEKEVEMRCRFNGSASATKTRATTEERERAIEAAESFEPANPFCRVVLQPAYVRSGLFLPSEFSAEHLKGASGFIELQNSDGKQWPVCCVYNKPRARLGQGWYEFTLENNLNEGDVCVFEVLRLKDIVLKVTVFRVLSFVSARGSTKCQKCIASLKTPLKHDYMTRNKRRKLEVEKETDVVVDVSDLRQSAYEVEIHSSDEKDKSKHSEHEFYALLKDMGMSLTRNFRNITAEDKERAVNVARFLKLTNPSFMVVLQSRILDNALLYVPMKFAGKYLSGDAKIIKLQVSDGREWPVQLSRRHGYVELTEGLTEFLKENNLGKGDMCLFELIRTDDFLLKVYFIQCSVNLID